MSLQGHRKFTQIAIFGLKIYHLATLACKCSAVLSSAIKSRSIFETAPQKNAGGLPATRNSMRPEKAGHLKL
jgi:hypothetical protein